MTSVNDIIDTTAAPEQPKPAATTNYFPWLFIVLLAVIVFGAVAAITTGGDIITKGSADAAVAATSGAVWPS